MSNDNHNFRLGVFILLGLAVIVAGVVVLGAGAMFKKTVYFETVTTESAEGLAVGAPVNFRGVNVGKVSSISVALMSVGGTDVHEIMGARNEIVIGMDLDEKLFRTKDLNVIRANFMKAADAGLRVRITSSGIAGPPYVEMLFLDPVANPAPKVSRVPSGPYIPSAQGTMSKIADDLGAVAGQLRQADMGKVIGNVDHLVKSVDQAVTDMQIADLRKQVGQVAASVDASTKRLSEILSSPKTEATINNVAAASGSIAGAALELRRTLRTLNDVLAGQEQDFAEAVLSLRQVFENTAAVTEDAKHNPARILFGAPPPAVNPGEHK